MPKPSGTMIMVPAAQTHDDRDKGVLPRATLTAAVICSLAACAPSSPRLAGAPTNPSATVPRVQPKAFTQVGLASWHGSAHARHQTASGELFNPDAMTAAHRTLPFGTLVHVTNIENGRTVTVRINDRGPQDVGRIIDLSRSAADALGFRANGTARVKVEQFMSGQ